MNLFALILAVLPGAEPARPAGLAPELRPPTRVRVAGQPLDVQRLGHAAPFVGDFDGDGVPDLLVSNMGTHRVVELPSGKELLRFKNEGGTGAVVYSPAAGVLACRFHTSPTVALTPFTLRPPTDAEEFRVAELLRACDSDDYATREKAAAALVEVGPAAESLLRRAMADGASPEVRMRARVARAALLNRPRFTLTGHADAVGPMAFSPDGKRFATGGADGVVILWDPSTGRELARLSVGAE